MVTPLRHGPAGASGDTTLVALGVAAIVVVLAGVAVLVDRVDPQWWTALVVALVLTAVTKLVVERVGRRDEMPWLSTVFMWGLAVTFAFAMFRWAFVFHLTSGGDAIVYDEAGATFVENLRGGGPIHPIPVIEPYPAESRRIGDAAGLVYTLTGRSAPAGFLVFSWICLMGKLLMVRALRVAVPEADHRRYALFLVLLPSLLFWPSSIGKEALMMGCLGLIMYGGGLLLGSPPRPRGLVWFTAGALLVALVRPHIAVMGVVGLGVAMAVGLLVAGAGRPEPSAGIGRRPGAPGRPRSRGRAVRLVALVLLGGLAVVGAGRVAAQFQSFGDDDAGAILAGAQAQSAIGESAFDPVSVDGILDVPAGVVSVLFRPFPWEAGNVTSLIAASEGLVLLAIVVLSWRRIASLPVLVRTRPYLAFAVTYVILFSVAFSFIANFGILARQRVLVLPALLVLVVLPVRERRGILDGARVRRTRRSGGGSASMSTGGRAESTGSLR